LFACTTWSLGNRLESLWESLAWIYNEAFNLADSHNYLWYPTIYELSRRKGDSIGASTQQYIPTLLTWTKLDQIQALFKLGSKFKAWTISVLICMEFQHTFSISLNYISSIIIQTLSNWNWWKLSPNFECIQLQVPKQGSRQVHVQLNIFEKNS